MDSTPDLSREMHSSSVSRTLESRRRGEPDASFLDHSNRVARALGSIADVGERRELEQQLLQARKMEAIGRLAGGVAHDFNNIINIIICYAEQALRQCGPEAAPAHQLRQILEASGRAAALTRQLLAFARKENVHPVSASLNSLVMDVQGMLRRLIGEDIALELDLDPQLAKVVVDPGQIGQLLMNLAANARDAMPGGGTLTLTTANAAAQAANDGRSAAKGRVLLRASDTGHGMPAEVMSHVFEPFFTTKPKGQGTGLGLAMIHEVVRQSGGVIEVESAVGVGTTFSIYLPATAGADTAPVERGPTRAGGSETILLVEDDAGLLEIMKDGLEDKGYEVLAAAGGQEAIDLSRKHTGTIDLLLTDVIMPGMSGHELASRLVVERPPLRTLYLSGYTPDFITRKGLPVDGMDLLPKPFTENALQDRIRQVLDQGAHSRERSVGDDHADRHA
jgi:signal transduction histidine kinase/ActR/RegA family two-component response regulator